MQRSQTASQETIAYDRASAKVDFLKPQPPVPGYPDFQVRFTFAPHGKFDSFLHFHAEHSEHLYCETGKIRLTLGTKVTIVGPEDGIVEIPRWTPHRWEVLGDSDQETIVWERNSPDPEFKELFFRNIFNLFNDHNGNPPPLQIIKLFADYDNFPVGANTLIQNMRSPIRLAVLVFGKVAGWAGYHSVYADYTPASLMNKSKALGLS